MISGLAVFRLTRFCQHCDLFEDARGNTYLFLHFSNQGLTGSLTILAMSSDNIPDAGIKGPFGRASGQQHLTSPNQQPTRAGSHGLAARSVPAALCII